MDIIFVYWQQQDVYWQPNKSGSALILNQFRKQILEKLFWQGSLLFVGQESFTREQTQVPGMCFNTELLQGFKILFLKFPFFYVSCCPELIQLFLKQHDYRLNIKYTKIMGLCVTVMVAS